MKLNKTLLDMIKQKISKGGSGSGNFGHAGRIGEVGGSLSGDVAGMIDDNVRNQEIRYKMMDDKYYERAKAEFDFDENISEQVSNKFYDFFVGDSDIATSELEKFVANELNRTDVSHKKFSDDRVNKELKNEMQFSKHTFKNDFKNGTTAYRGVTGNLAKKIYDAKQKGLSEIRIKTTALESYSLSKNVAKDFAGDLETKSQVGVVFSQKINPNDVVSYYKAYKQGHAFTSEKEVSVGHKEKYITIKLKDISAYKFDDNYNVKLIKTNTELKNGDIIGDLGDNENFHWMQKTHKLNIKISNNKKLNKRLLNKVKNKIKKEVVKMPYTKENYPDYIKNLPEGARNKFINAFNSTLKETDDEETARIAGWVSVKSEYIKNKKTDEWEKKEKQEVKKDNDVSFIYKADEQRLVYGIVYEPNTVDAQGDYSTSEEIEKACHLFMTDYKKFNKQHKGAYLDSDKEISIVENYIAPMEFVLGDSIVKKGSWVLVVKILDDELWKDVKDGKYSGYSMEGSGIEG